MTQDIQSDAQSMSDIPILSAPTPVTWCAPLSRRHSQAGQHERGVKLQTLPASKLCAGTKLVSEPQLPHWAHRDIPCRPMKDH